MQRPFSVRCCSSGWGFAPSLTCMGPTPIPQLCLCLCRDQGCRSGGSLVISKAAFFCRLVRTTVLWFAGTLVSQVGNQTWRGSQTRVRGLPTHYRVAGQLAFGNLGSSALTKNSRCGGYGVPCFRGKVVQGPTPHLCKRAQPSASVGRVLRLLPEGAGWRRGLFVVVSLGPRP